MPIEAQRFQELLNIFDFHDLFTQELGWDHPEKRINSVLLDGTTFELAPVAQKRGVTIFQCSPGTDEKIPPRSAMIKLDKEATKLKREHLLIFTDKARTTQTWLWVKHDPGKPAAVRTHTWHKGTSGELLRQKLERITFTLDEEEAITLTLAEQRLRDAFDRDRVTKQFYDRFAQEHKDFAGFIHGITDQTDQAWYASLMLNRLMFVWFIQKKDFLDNNINYLADRLAQVRSKAGKGKFHSFYRLFLRRLFHEGFGKASPRGAELDSLLGEIPYLNGGLFDVHQLEESNPQIDIPDEAFEKLFQFFDKYDWHLDNRPLSNQNEINPDVLGYIFEKYVNQKQMGAYYTKEDITGYISRNTILPFLLDRARERCKVAFEGDASVWSLLAADPDRYLYPAMRCGVVNKAGRVIAESVLPDFVQAGMHDAKARMFDKRYNLATAQFETPDGEQGTLPTETWREYVARRERCLEIRQKMKNGELRSVDDLVTYNLDIRQFVQDVVDQYAGVELLRALWQAIVGRVPGNASQHFQRGLSVLDPTCGSGAFLFAALNVLEPIYEACIERMQDFVEEADRAGRREALPDFRAVLAEIQRHPSRAYFIYKSIVVHNLFGVDIMAEAVEICKLRLFLKLVSQVEDVRQLEPLPDIDFNIRTGNALVGYATLEEFEEQSRFFNSQQRKDILARAADLSDAFDRFREQQTRHGGQVTSADKHDLRDRLSALALELDGFLAKEYGVDPDKKRAFHDWQRSHHPFHWMVEFYGVMRDGGFDVVIGNPPYLEAREVPYRPINFKTLESNAIHAMCVERSLDILSADGAISMIVPMALTSTQRMKPLQEMLEANRTTIYANFAWRPAKLFDTVNRALTIFVACASSAASTWTTGYQKWSSDDRQGLLDRMLLFKVPRTRDHFWVPKLATSLDRGILNKLVASNGRVGDIVARRSREGVFYRTTGGLYWKVFTDFAPAFSVKGVPGASSRETKLPLSSREALVPVAAALSSSTFWWWYTIASNLRDLNPTDIHTFPLPRRILNDKSIERLGRKYLSDIKRNSSMLVRVQRQTGTTQTQSFKIAKSKSVIDEIDCATARYYGFDDSELDVIINYDIKYRMGSLDDE